MIEGFAKKLVASSSTRDQDGLLLRYVTICNGSLLRDGSRSIKVGTRGARIVELATYPPTLSDVIGVKRIWIAQTAMTARLREAGLQDEARKADQTFRENEGWLYLMQRQSPEENLRTMCLASIGFSALPGSFLVCAIVGGAMLLVVRLLGTGLDNRDRFSVKLVLVLAAFSAGTSFCLTALWPVSLCVGLCVAFLAANPGRRRSVRDREFGPMFSFTIGCVWLAAATGLATFLVSTSTAAKALLPMLGPPGEYLADSRLFLAAALLMACLIFLIAPAWALVHRQPTPLVFGAALRRLSLYFASGSLILCAISGPISVLGDHAMGVELQNILANEPIYYLVK